ncbi:MAG: protein-L-isoaspartate(D-aspartate) O-methyltransferase [Methylococcaceae bacterium]|nr:MAG: protein-L-isoaspartate(D-aspartate) O-methyltransferase [Methylococcaceae bacterium]
MNQRLELEGSGMTSRRTRLRMLDRLRAQGIRNEAILEVMLNTPRHLFVETGFAERAYEDTALPIGQGQTISQPYSVARMTELLLEYGRPDNVLEVGTGCGYQTAVLASLVKKVSTVERILPLQQRAKDLLWSLKYRNIRFKHSDGGWGWPEYGPYDGILVTAAPAEIPEALLKQLARGGVMIIPVGAGREQILQRVVHEEQGLVVESIEHATFVPLLAGVI